MTVIEEMLGNAERYAEAFDKGGLPMPPAKHVAVVACMDARLNPQGLLGLEEGDAHVVRNAGGVITDDVIRSLAISQRLLGTIEIMLIHHTDCGMLTFRDDELKAQIASDTGIRPPCQRVCEPPSGGDRNDPRWVGECRGAGWADLVVTLDVLAAAAATPRSDSDARGGTNG
jgi:carbonic anhydrase